METTKRTKKRPAKEQSISEILAANSYNHYMNFVDNQQTKTAIALTAKLIAETVPFEYLDEAIMALTREIIDNVQLNSPECAKLIKADAVLHLVKELKKGRFNIGIYSKEEQVLEPSRTLWPISAIELALRM